MANRYLYQFKGSFEAGVVTIYAKITFGSSGAPTLASSSSGQSLCKGIASISRVSAGKYDITLQDSYVRLMSASHVFEESAAPAAPQMYIISDASSTLSAPVIRVQFANAGVATDPANGDAVLLKLDFKNSSAGA